MGGCVPVFGEFSSNTERLVVLAFVQQLESTGSELLASSALKLRNVVSLTP